MPNDTDAYELSFAGEPRLRPESETDVPSSVEFYWKMKPPNRSPFSDASELSKAGGFGPAPRLEPNNEPVNGGGMMDAAVAYHLQSKGLNTSPATHINVRDTHHWTESPISSRREVPVLNLKEQRIMANPMINQLINNVGAAATAGANFWNAVNNFIEKASDQGLSKALQETASFAGQRLTGTGNAGLNPTGSADPMNPYSMLYTTLPTGFKYSLPYMQDQWSGITSSFGGEGHGKQGFIDGLAELGAGVANDITRLSGEGLIAAGSFLEQPKYFNFSGRENTYTVSFPLLNTKSYSEVIRNWQFLFLLAYQCLPNRVNRQIIDPPCIYEAYIPGVWYSKYTSITSLQVDFKGARREMYVPISFMELADASASGQGSGKWKQQMRKMLVVIPDAYYVTITLTELFGDSQNSKYQLMRESMNDKIRTGVITT